jgi:hypothetical protein
MYSLESFIVKGEVLDMWSNDQRSCTDPEVRFRFPALPNFLRNSGSGMGSIQPREYN